MRPRGPAWLACIYALAERITTDDYPRDERVEWPEDAASYAPDVAEKIVPKVDGYALEAAPSDYLDAAEYLLTLAMADAASRKEERAFARLLNEITEARALASTTPETKR